MSYQLEGELKKWVAEEKARAEKAEARIAELEADNARLQEDFTAFKIRLRAEEHTTERLQADLAAYHTAVEKMLTITQSMIKGYISPYKLEEAEAAAQAVLSTDHPGALLLAVVEAAQEFADNCLPSGEGWGVDAPTWDDAKELVEALAALPSGIPDRRGE